MSLSRETSAVARRRAACTSVLVARRHELRPVGWPAALARRTRSCATGCPVAMLARRARPTPAPRAAGQAPGCPRRRARTPPTARDQAGAMPARRARRSRVRQSAAAGRGSRHSAARASSSDLPRGTRTTSGSASRISHNSIGCSRVTSGSDGSSWFIRGVRTRSTRGRARGGRQPPATASDRTSLRPPRPASRWRRSSGTAVGRISDSVGIERLRQRGPRTRLLIEQNTGGVAHQQRIRQRLVEPRGGRVKASGPARDDLPGGPP